ncbi:Phage tail collar domain containing protein [uncultured Caudovirales phage]|uniref:Phage tail collar domain containing protein n=1 Tax=uncultured Caudovirales phage TaxID=2100421 RepID=A0A6J5PPF1_9CAUD|nr:Phage tail collar domain containing protein [uncultured Caudovirales phage]
MSSVFPAESALGAANYSGSDVEDVRIKLAAAGPIPTAVLYNNAKDLSKALVAASALASVPTGTISAFAGVTLPTGYLWCDGAAQLKASYPDLYLVLGASRYAVDTATQFYTPNLTSHLPRGAATTGGVVTTNNNNTHGHGNNATTVGNPTVAVTNNNNATSLAHNHNVNAGSTSSTGGHNHNINGTTTTGGANGNAAVGNTVSKSNSAHQHTVSGQSTADTGVHNHNNNATSTASDGGTLAHSHANTATATQGTVTTGTVIDNSTYVPAFVEVNYIIKT